MPRGRKRSAGQRDLERERHEDGQPEDERGGDEAAGAHGGRQATGTAVSPTNRRGTGVATRRLRVDVLVLIAVILLLLAVLLVVVQRRRRAGGVIAVDVDREVP